MSDRDGMSYFIWMNGVDNMMINRKNYAFVYLINGTKENEVQSIVKYIENMQVEVESIAKTIDYRTWLTDDRSVNPSLFISNYNLGQAGFDSLDNKLESSVIIIYGKEASNIQQSSISKNKEHSNVLKKFISFEDMMNYFYKNVPTDLNFRKLVMETEQEVSNHLDNIPAPPNNDRVPDFPEDISVQHIEDEYNEEALEKITEVAERKRGESAAPVNKSSIEEKRGDLEEPEKLIYEENHYHLRSRAIQKQLFTNQKWESHQTIGVWSPLHRMGVTSFTFNFALFLSEYRVYTAVLEGLTEKHALKSWLERYTYVPAGWSSYAKAIHTDGITQQTKWIYKDVMFLPLEKEDIQLEWNSFSLESYMTTSNLVDVTLVDLPTGKMTAYTEDSLSYLNQLWIIIDDATQDLLAWKEYIHAIHKRTNIPIHLIFNKTYSFSKFDRISKEMGLPLLAKIPSLHEETMRNYYEAAPIYMKKEVQEKLKDPFIVIAKHLLGKDFDVNASLPLPNKEKWSKRVYKLLKGF